MYVRTVKVRSSSGALSEYVRAVEAYREDGKVKQRVVADPDRKDLRSATLNMGWLRTVVPSPSSVHLGLERPDPAAVEVELHVGVIGQERHRHR
jgi:hypothetical protein